MLEGFNMGLMRHHVKSIEIHPKPKNLFTWKDLLVQTVRINTVAVEFAGQRERHHHVIVRSTKPESVPYPTDKIYPIVTTIIWHRTRPLPLKFKHPWFASAVNPASSASCWTSDAFFGKWNQWYPLGKGIWMQGWITLDELGIVHNSVPQTPKTLWSTSALRTFLHPWDDNFAISIGNEM